MSSRCSWVAHLRTALAAALVVGIGATAAHAADGTPVSLRFSWKLKGEYAPLYAALDNGYYRKQGLDVRLGEGAGSQAALASLLRGDDQAVWMPGIFALQAISKGMAVKLIALYNPAAPILFISWPSKPIRTPKDFIGKTVATAVGETGTTFLPVLCEKNHIDCSKITLVRMAIQARVPAFVAHKVDSVSVYRTNDLPILNAKFGPHAFVELDEAAWGAGVPGSALVASDAYLAKHPEVLVKLVRAVDEGMAFSSKHPLAAAKIMLKHWSASLTPAVVADQVKGLMAAVPKDEDKPMGYLDPKVLEAALHALKAAHQVAAVQPVADYYTNSIVEKASAH